MKNWKNILEMKLEENTMPWQIVEGDNETWVILRRRVSLAPNAIQEISGSSIDFSKWTVFETAGEGTVCKGNLGLVITYKLQKESGPLRLSNAGGTGEALFQDYFQQGVSLEPQKWQQGPGEYSSAFTSLLVKDPYQKGVGSGEEVHLDLPWQVRIRSARKISEPEAVLIHLFQEGISTILVEAVLKLNHETTKPRIVEKNKHYLTAEEGVAVIQDDRIQEAIALVVKRSFKNIDCGVAGRVLRVRAVARYTLVYLSQNVGGPRIQAAYCLKEEENIYKPHSLPPYLPANQRYYNSSSLLTKIDSQKAAYKFETFLEITNDLLSPEEKPQLFQEPSLPPKPITVSCKTRKRPGEKWFKKEGCKNSGPAKNKTVLCIRLH